MGEWTDWTLFFHAVLLVVLAGMIFRAAWIKHRSRLWRMWPPTLLAAWGVSELLDGLIYGRRWLAQESTIPYIRYESYFSLFLNLLSLLAVLLLMVLIYRGDAQMETKDARDRRQDHQQEVLDGTSLINAETSRVNAERGNHLSTEFSELERRRKDLRDEEG